MRTAPYPPVPPITARTRGSVHISMKLAARRSSSARVYRRTVARFGSTMTP
jgi:hypothetical protein